VLEVSVKARRGSFRLEVDCLFLSDWTVLFGPSGSGKSTMLRIIAGLDQPAAKGPEHSRISMDGQLLTDSASGFALPPGRRQTSLVAQQPSLFPHLSVMANIEYGLRGLDRKSRKARVEEMLELVDAKALVNRRTRELSGGEAQRIALARALAPRPRLLLLDEPFSALDGAASDALLGRLERWLPANRVQTLMATHDATDAFATHAAVALLMDGKIEALGPAHQVLAHERQRLLGRIGGR
jgi:ABC-type Fe3+/spermidine/putrescine transport system ATPase subunit